MATSIGRLFAIIGADTSEWDRKMKGLSQSAGKLGKSLTMKLTLPILAIGGAAVKMGADFEQAMVNAKAVSGATAEEFVMMEQVARDMGKATVFSAKEAADAMYYMASAGWKANDMAKAIKPTLDLAAATQSELAFTTNAVVASLNQFQLGSEGAERVTNVFAAAIGNSQATLEKLKISMTYIGPLAKSLGYSIEGTTATLMSLYNAGYEASTAGTALRMSFAKLMEGSQKTREGLKMIGLALEDVNPKFNTQEQIIRKLENAGMGAAEAIKIFGVRSGPAMVALVGQGSNAIAEFEEKITDTTAASDMAEMQVDTLKGSFKLLKSIVTEVAIQFSKILGPALKDLIDNKIRPAIEKFSEMAKWKKELIVKVAALAAALGPLLLVFSKLTGVIAAMPGLLVALASPVGIVVAALALLAITIGKVKRGIDDMTGKTWRKSIKAMNDAEAQLKSHEVGYREFLVAVKDMGKEADSFWEKFLLNKSDAAKTIQQLKDGEIKGSKEVVAVYMQMAKEAEKRAEAEKKAMEDISRFAMIEAKDKKSLEVATIALAQAQEALIGTEEDWGLALGAVQDALSSKYRVTSEVSDQLKALEARLKTLIAREKERREGLSKDVALQEEYVKFYNLEVGLTLDQQAERIQWLTKYQEWLNDQLRDGKIELEAYAKAMDGVNREMATLTEKIVDTTIPAAKDFGDMIVWTGDQFDTLPAKAEIATGEMSTSWKTTATEMGEDWEAATSEMVTEWTNTIADIILKNEDLATAFNELGKAGLEIFVDMFAKIVADFTVELIKPLMKVFGELFKSMAINIAALAKYIVSNPAGMKMAFAAVAAYVSVNLVKTILSGLGIIRTGYDEAGKAILENLEEIRAAGGFILEQIEKSQLSKLWPKDEDTKTSAQIYKDAIESIITQFKHLDEGGIYSKDRLIENFEAMVGAAEELGITGSAEMAMIVLKMKELGVESESLSNFIIKQFERIPEPLTTLIDVIPSVGDSVEDLRERLAAQNEELEGMEVGTKEYAKLRKEITETEGLIARQIENIALYSDDLEGLGIIAVDTFQGMRNEGVPWTEAVEAMKDPLIALRDKYEELGLESDGTLEKLFEIVEATEKHGELFEAIDANKEIIEALGMAGALTQESLEVLGRNAVKSFEDLTAAGVDSDIALQALAPSLQDLVNYADAYGLELDDATQALVDQAREAGHVVDAQEDIGKVTEDIRDAVVEMKDAILEFLDALKEPMAATVDFKYEIPDFEAEIGDLKIPVDFEPRDGTDTTFVSPTIPELQEGGIVMRETLARIGEVPEAVIPLHKLGQEGLGGLGGGTKIEMNNTIYAMDSEDVYHFMEQKAAPALVKLIEGNVSGITKAIKEETEAY